MKSSILTIFSGHFSQITKDPPLLEAILYPGWHTHELPEKKPKGVFNLCKTVFFFTEY